MTIGVLTFTLFMPQSDSLKAKRSVLCTLKNKLVRRFNVCVAEIDCQDKWQKAVLAAGVINNDSKFIDTTFNSIIKFMSNSNDYELLDYHQELI
jgi:uncharacterized protein YlxP (DUF503 family)